MAYTTINKPSQYFNTVLYTGTETQQTINVGFQPDFVWIKSRSNVQVHALFDAVRGVSIGALQSNATAAENANQKLVAYTSNGFTLPSTNYEWTNTSGWTFAAWNWLGANSTTSNTSGTITSTVSANTTSGFSIVSYTGNGSNGATIGHGLGVAPKMVIPKCRSDASDWSCYHASLSASNNIFLNLTQAQSPIIDRENGGISTTSSTTFTVAQGSNSLNSVNGSGRTYIAYCFAEVKGFSKFGSYTGNGSTDGTFVYTGFKPAFIMVKVTDITNSWFILDNKRLGYNPTELFLNPNSDSAESGSTGAYVDFTSNGFKWRTTSNAFNGSSNNYIYAAFAENPFVSSTFIPTTAR